MDYLSESYSQWLSSPKDEKTSYSLADLASGAKLEVLHAYSIAASGIQRLSEDLKEAQRRVKTKLNIGKQDESTTYQDWITGYELGKRDESLGKMHQSIADIYQQASDNVHWGSGYFQGRLDEAKRAANETFQGPSAFGWQLTMGMWKKAQEAASDTAGKYQDAVNSGSDWVKESVIEPAKGAVNEAIQAGQEAKDTVYDAVVGASDTASDMGNKAGGWFWRYGNGAAQTVSKVASDTQEMAKDTGASAQRGAEWVRDQITDNLWQDNQQSETDRGIYEKARSAFTKSGNDDTSYITKLNEKVEQARSSAATYLNQRVDQLTKTAESVAESARQEAEEVDREIRGDLKDVVEHLKESSDSAQETATADRDRVVAYIQDTLYRLERNAQDGYKRAQQSKKETEKEVGQQIQSLKQQVKQMGDSSATKTEDKFEKVANQVLEQSSRAEEGARERYEKVHEMYEQTKYGLENNLTQVIETMHDWLGQAQQEAQQIYNKALTDGRIISDELMNDFHAAADRAFSKSEDIYSDWWNWIADSARNTHNNVQDKVYENVLEPAQQAQKTAYATFSSVSQQAEDMVHQANYQDGYNRLATGSKKIISQLSVTVFYGTLLVLLAMFLMRSVNVKRERVRHPERQTDRAPGAKDRNEQKPGKDTSGNLNKTSDGTATRLPPVVGKETTLDHKENIHAQPAGLLAGQHYQTD